MKKILSIIMVVLMFALSLTGCGSVNKTKSAESTVDLEQSEMGSTELYKETDSEDTSSLDDNVQEEEKKKDNYGNVYSVYPPKKELLESNNLTCFQVGDVFIDTTTIKTADQLAKTMEDQNVQDFILYVRDDSDRREYNPDELLAPNEMVYLEMNFPDVGACVFGSEVMNNTEETISLKDAEINSYRAFHLYTPLDPGDIYYATGLRGDGTRLDGSHLNYDEAMAFVKDLCKKDGTSEDSISVIDGSNGDIITINAWMNTCSASISIDKTTNQSTEYNQQYSMK